MYSGRRSIFKGMLFGLPITLFCWGFVWFNAKSRFAFIWGNVWFGLYTAVVLVGFFWPIKRS
jgi:hypothetical protein